jgi:pimeloyl-ACP methyl ester carboxylesterase
MFLRRRLHSLRKTQVTEDTMDINRGSDGREILVHHVRGGGGTELHVEETGNRGGRPVLFIHGLSQCRLSWHWQMHSDLGDELRLVAMDLRGHGLSNRPVDGYGDPSLWAEDLHAVMTALDLERPILCGWSYGGVVIGDYVRRYGEQAIGGINLVAAVSRLGEPAMPFLGPEFLATLPGLFSDEVAESIAAVQEFVRLGTRVAPTPEDFYQVVGYTCVVPPRVRQALLSRSFVQDDVLERVTTPVLITHGLADAVVLPAMSEHHARLIAHAKTSYYGGVGHAPFVESPDRFNAELLEFASSL